jgi:hypothetical protein
MATAPNTKNPRRVAAGRLNQKKSKGLTPAGLEKRRQVTLAVKPWLRSTGPKTPEGKAKAAKNGMRRQKGARSIREIRRDRAELRGLLVEMVAARFAAVMRQV